jgi:amidophosphoribosyltransferase
MENTIHEECGIFGVYAPEQNHPVATEAYYGLFALQHRGQESCGIAVNDRGVIVCHKDVGLVRDVFTAAELEKLGTGQMAIGHTRYSTFGTVNRTNAQPLVVRHIKGQLAIAHNGNLTNATELRRQLEFSGAIFHTTNDSEIISYMIIRERLTASSIEAAVDRAMDRLEGAYSLVIMSPEKLIAVRDETGYRPLVMGKTKEGEIIFASETCALDVLGAEYIRDLDAGEIVVVDSSGIRSIRTHCKGRSHMCVFEFVYFARPDSYIAGMSVHEARRNAGKILAKEHPVDADVVIGVPDSGLDAALGYAEESGIPYGMGFVKNRYIARTFIQPTQAQRDNGVRMKLNVVPSVIKGKRVIMVDDSIVRGTTSARIVKLLRDAGAKEVHVRVSAPPFISPCYYGTDIDSKEHLIACQMSEEGICQMIGADTLGYLSVEGVKKMASEADCDFCVGCFTEKYPSAVPERTSKDRFEKKIGESSEPYKGARRTEDGEEL